MVFNKVSVLAVLVALTVLPGAVQAQQAKVLKVQGKKAIVQFPDDVKPRVGQLIEVGEGQSEGSMTAGHGAGSREMIVGGSASFTSLTTSSSSTSTSTLDLSGRYGWNKGEMEYGGLGSFYYTSTTGSSSRTIGVGGFFDYNVVPNTAGTELVYGAGAEALYAMVSTTTGSAETSATTLRFQGGGQMKWFPFGNTVAVRGDVVYRFQQNGGTTSSTTSGLVALGGLYVYF
ncbi:MAG: hypothetical protein JNJ49_13135 [Bdellovibrionaceae bacterium]|nr:hypothetical protein [Pseudobdellovibrionaceae bacterium]